MRISTLVICAFVIGGALALAGCGHKLVAHNGESTVAVYPDEDTFTKLVDLKKQGGVGGMIGGLGEGLAAKQVDNNTPVRISQQRRQGLTDRSPRRRVQRPARLRPKRQRPLNCRKTGPSCVIQSEAKNPDLPVQAARIRHGREGALEGVEKFEILATLSMTQK